MSGLARARGRIVRRQKDAPGAHAISCLPGDVLLLCPQNASELSGFPGRQALLSASARVRTPAWLRLILVRCGFVERRPSFSLLHTVTG